MSFSNDVRNELARIIPEKTCCQKAELSAMVSLKGQLQTDPVGAYILQVEMDSAAAARKVYRLMKNLYEIQPTVSMRENRRCRKTRVYLVTVRILPEQNWILGDLGLMDQHGIIRQEPRAGHIRKNCCRRAYIRGVFISRGSINRPEGTYHLEMVFSEARLPLQVQKILSRFHIEARLSERKNGLLVLYIKESEAIVDFLRLVGASSALLEFENVRIIKSVRNQVNRQVNCETANLARMVDASVRQVELIEQLIEKEGIKGLPHNFRELALVRIEHPDSTLRELGTLLDPPLSKSGVAYRMRKLEEYAQERLQDT
jgi:DNA-binding protein WhiA